MADRAHDASEAYTVKALRSAALPSEARITFTLTGVYSRGRYSHCIEWAIRRLALAWPDVDFCFRSPVIYFFPFVGILSQCDTLTTPKEQRINILALKGPSEGRLQERFQQVMNASELDRSYPTNMAGGCMRHYTHKVTNDEGQDRGYKRSDVTIIEGLWGGISNPLHHDNELQLIFIDARPIERCILHEFLSSLYLECGKALECPECTEHCPRSKGNRRRHKPNHHHSDYQLLRQSQSRNRRPVCSDRSCSVYSSKANDCVTLQDEALRQLGEAFKLTVPDKSNRNLLDRLVFDKIFSHQRVISPSARLRSMKRKAAKLSPSPALSQFSERAKLLGSHRGPRYQGGYQVAQSKIPRGNSKKITGSCEIEPASRRVSSERHLSFNAARSAVLNKGIAPCMPRVEDLSIHSMPMSENKSVANEVVTLTESVISVSPRVADANATDSTVASTADIEPHFTPVKKVAVASKAVTIAKSSKLCSAGRSERGSYTTVKRHRASTMSVKSRKMIRSCEELLKSSTRTRPLEVLEPAPIGSPVQDCLMDINFHRDMFDRLTDTRQVDNKFIIGRLGGTLIAIDQHAAGERVGLEMLMKSKGLLTSQPITEAQLSIKPTDVLTLMTRKDILVQHGWRYTVVGTTVRVIGVPKVKSGLLSASPHHLLPWAEQLPFPAQLHYMCSTTACRQAVKFGDAMTHHGVSEMIRRLSKCDAPFQCAHGRPTIYPLCDIPIRHTRNVCPDPVLSMLVIDPLLL